jgi:hypothetical protein
VRTYAGEMACNLAFLINKVDGDAFRAIMQLAAVQKLEADGNVQLSF